MRWRLVIEYDGSDFAGWARQDGQRTVEGVLGEAARKLFGHEVDIDVAGRTDAGVHAEGQVAALSSEATRSEREVRNGLNAYLPEDVAIVEATVATADFDPRRFTKTKRYQYRWLDRQARSPLRRSRVWLVHTALDASAMHEAARALVGQHDFTSFRAQGCQAAHAIRTLKSWDVSRVGDEVVLETVGHGYLRHMVRIVAGTLYEVGRGARPASWVGEVLEAKDRTRAGRTAPPHGLTLIGVTHGEAAGAYLEEESG